MLESHRRHSPTRVEDGVGWQRRREATVCLWLAWRSSRGVGRASDVAVARRRGTRVLLQWPSRPVACVAQPGRCCAWPAWQDKARPVAWRGPVRPARWCWLSSARARTLRPWPVGMWRGLAVARDNDDATSAWPRWPATDVARPWRGHGHAWHGWPRTPARRHGMDDAEAFRLVWREAAKRPSASRSRRPLAACTGAAVAGNERLRPACRGEDEVERRRLARGAAAHGQQRCGGPCHGCTWLLAGWHGKEWRSGGEMGGRRKQRWRRLVGKGARSGGAGAFMRHQHLGFGDGRLRSLEGVPRARGSHRAGAGARPPGSGGTWGAPAP